MPSKAKRQRTTGEPLTVGAVRDSFRREVPHLQLAHYSGPDTERLALAKQFNAILRRVHPDRRADRFGEPMPALMIAFSADLMTLNKARAAFEDLLLDDEHRVLIILLVDELLSRHMTESSWFPGEYYQDEFGITAARLRQKLKRGELTAVKVGGRNHYSMLDVRRLCKHEMPTSIPDQNDPRAPRTRTRPGS